MAKGLAHTRLLQASTMHCKRDLRGVLGSDSEVLGGRVAVSGLAAATVGGGLRRKRVSRSKWRREDSD
jgi:hypothetical protein